MADAYSSMSQKLQNSLNENSNYEKTIQELKVLKHNIQFYLSIYFFYMWICLGVSRAG